MMRTAAFILIVVTLLLLGALGIAWLSVFKHMPAGFSDTFYWITAPHLVVMLLWPRMALGSWVCCTLGLLCGAGAFA